ncbi:MAG: hypothetical protein NC548_19890 [Lachnospiraceae bacterium]|nr:hypothetical protein [Lachnospiraceae bacterium]
MTFNTLTIQNFLSIKSVTLELNNRGMVLIQGENRDNSDFQSNGAGKSSITEALTYVLYGKTIRGLKGDDVVNRVSKRNTKVVLDLTDDDGTEYRIVRYRKHQQQGNKYYLFRNSTDITPKSESDFTAAVVGLLQMDFMTFTSSILYSANSFKFTSATDSELKAAFDTLLGLALYTDCQATAKAQLKTKENTRLMLNSKFHTYQDHVTQLRESAQKAESRAAEFVEKQQERIDQCNEQLEELSGLYADLIKQRDEQTEAVKAAKKEVAKAEAEVKNLAKTIESVEMLQKEIETCEGMLVGYDRETSKLDSKISSAQAAIDQCQKFIDRCNGRSAKLQEKIDDIQGTIGSPCPTCGAPLTEDSVQTAIAEVKGDIQEIDEEITVYNEEIQQHKSEQARANARKAELNGKRADVEDDLDAYQKLMEKSGGVVQRHNAAMQVLSDAKVKLSKLEGKVEQFNLRIQTAAKEQDAQRQAIAQIKAETNTDAEYARQYQEQADEEAKMAEAVQRDCDAVSEEIECLKFWVTAYGNRGIKSLLLDDITPYLNRQANRFLHKLSSDHMEIRFTTQSMTKGGELRDKFSIEVINADGGVSYAANSSGEKKRVDLAINLALQSLVSSRSNKKLNLIMLDEILDSLDDAGVEHVMELLQELAQEKSSIFVISHNDSIKSVFTDTITIVKENGYSMLKE